MKTRALGSRIAIGGGVAIVLALPTVIFAQQCPPELAQASSKIAAMQAATTTPTAQTPPRAPAGARQEIQAPRGEDRVDAPRGQDVQAPRGEDRVGAPRGQDVQAPRGQEGQAPRGQDVQAPRAQDPQAAGGQDAQASPRGQDPSLAKLERARQLVTESERACKAGNMALSSEKAKAALATLN